MGPLRFIIPPINSPNPLYKAKSEDSFLQNSILADMLTTVHDAGEVSEWLIEQPWKGCVGLVPTAGSNPALSVIKNGLFVEGNLIHHFILLRTTT